LNIPDTSGRDSLFQAEARRCKEILDVIHENKKSRHFCIFDELYSGTNPEEAVSSATAFMEYIVKNKNMSCLLTTHFVKVCKNLKKNENVVNCQMESEKVNDVIHYKYKLKPGISLIKGGASVLKAMDYPKELLIHFHL
jgi:DNA mismatch repair protein MutS